MLQRNTFLPSVHRILVPVHPAIPPVFLQYIYSFMHMQVMKVPHAQYLRAVRYSADSMYKPLSLLQPRISPVLQGKYRIEQHTRDADSFPYSVYHGEVSQKQSSFLNLLLSHFPKQKVWSTLLNKHSPASANA